MQPILKVQRNEKAIESNSRDDDGNGKKWLSLSRNIYSVGWKDISTVWMVVFLSLDGFADDGCWQMCKLFSLFVLGELDPFVFWDDLRPVWDEIQFDAFHDCFNLFDLF